MHWANLRRVAGLVACYLAISAPAALAAELPNRTVELSTGLMFTHTSYAVDGNNTGSTTELQVQEGLGYCVNDLLELNGSLVLIHQSVNPRSGTSIGGTSYGFGGSLVFNFPSKSSIIPFLQGGFALLAYSGDMYENAETTYVLPSIGVGLRFLVTESASINSGLYYQHISNALGVEDVSANQLYFGLSISILFIPRLTSG
jgi:hypothetical protein